MVGEQSRQAEQQARWRRPGASGSLARQAEQRPQPDADRAAGQRRRRTTPSRAASPTRRRRRRRRCCSRSRAARPSPSAGRRARPRRATSSGGHGLRANGAVAAAAAIAPRIMPRSVRLDVSLRIESPSARLGPGHCQNSASERSKPSERRELAAPHREAERHAPGVAAGREHRDREQADQRPRRSRCARDGTNDAPRRRAIAMTASAAARKARPGGGEPAPGAEIVRRRGSDRCRRARRNAGSCRLPITLPTMKKASVTSMRPEPPPAV